MDAGSPQFTCSLWLFLSIINEELECVVGVAQGVCGVVAAIHGRDLEALKIKPAADTFLCEIRMCKFCFLLVSDIIRCRHGSMYLAGGVPSESVTCQGVYLVGMYLLGCTFLGTYFLGMYLLELYLLGGVPGIPTPEGTWDQAYPPPGRDLGPSISTLEWTWDQAYPSPLWTDKHYWKHYFPATSLAGGKYLLFETQKF